MCNGCEQRVSEIVLFFQQEKPSLGLLRELGQRAGSPSPRTSAHRSLLQGRCTARRGRVPTRSVGGVGPQCCQSTVHRCQRCPENRVPQSSVLLKPLLAFTMAPCMTHSCLCRGQGGFPRTGLDISLPAVLAPQNPLPPESI